MAKYKQPIKKEYKDTPTAINNKLNEENYIDIKKTLAAYVEAVRMAKDIKLPNRSYLLDIYSNIMLDPHLESLIAHRKKRITGLSYSVLNAKGKPDKANEWIFDEEWFSKFIDLTLDGLFYGNSLIEINNDNGIKPILIPRYNVIPEFKQLKLNTYSTYGDIDYSQPAYMANLVDVNNNNDSRNLGELLYVAKLLMLKNESLLNWAQHIEIFGQPIRIATTDTANSDERNLILQRLKTMGRSGYMIKDSKTLIEFVEASGKSASSDMYNDFEKFVNDEVSKVILGGTMLTDSGSSRSQSEVHLEGSYLFTKADIKFVESVVNNQLIPILRTLGYISAKGISFKFTEPEILSVEDKLKIDTFLITNFDLDPTYFEDRYNVKLKLKNVPIIDVNNQSPTDNTPTN